MTDEIHIGRRHVRLTSADRVLFPADGVHEGRPCRVLRGDRAGDRAAPPRPAVHAQRLPHGIDDRRCWRSRRGRASPSWVPNRQFRTLTREGGSAASSTSRSSTSCAVVWIVQMISSTSTPGPRASTESLTATTTSSSTSTRPDRETASSSFGDPSGAPSCAALERLEAPLLREDQRRQQDPRAPADRAATRTSSHIQPGRASSPEGQLEGDTWPQRHDEWLEEQHSVSSTIAERPREDDRVRVLRAAEARRTVSTPLRWRSTARRCARATSDGGALKRVESTATCSSPC